MHYRPEKWDEGHRSTCKYERTGVWRVKGVWSHKEVGLASSPNVNGFEDIDGVPAKRSKNDHLVPFPEAKLGDKLSQNLVFAVPPLIDNANNAQETGRCR